MSDEILSGQVLEAQRVLERELGEVGRGVIENEPVMRTCLALAERWLAEDHVGNLDEVTIDRLIDENWRLRQIEKAAQAVCDRTGNIAALRLALDGKPGGRKPAHPPNPEARTL